MNSTTTPGEAAGTNASAGFARSTAARKFARSASSGARSLTLIGAQQAGGSGPPAIAPGPAAREKTGMIEEVGRGPFERRGLAEAGEAVLQVIDVRDLPHLAVADDIDAGLHLLRDDLGDRFAHAPRQQR